MMLNFGLREKDPETNIFHPGIVHFSALQFSQDAWQPSIGYPILVLIPALVVFMITIARSPRINCLPFIKDAALGVTMAHDYMIYFRSLIKTKRKD